MIDEYECGIFTRIHGWFEALDIDYETTPAFNGCLMRDKGKCEVMFYFHLA